MSVKKNAELNNIATYPDPRIKHQLIKTGRGNPRLMELLNTLVGEVKDATSLLSKAKGKQEEFVQGLVLRQLLESQPEAFQIFLRRSAVYRLPVLKDGIDFVCDDLLQDSADLYDPVSSAELIEHALKSGQEDIVIEEAGAWHC